MWKEAVKCILRHSGIYLEVLRKTMINLHRDSHPLGWDLNPGPPAGVITTLPWYLVLVYFLCHCVINEFSVPESEDIAGPWPQVNSRTFSYPSFPLLTQRNEITRDMYCTDEDVCADGSFCACSYLYDIKLGSLVEIVFIDLGKLYTWSSSKAYMMTRCLILLLPEHYTKYSLIL